MVLNQGNTGDEEGIQSHTKQLQLLQLVKCGQVCYSEAVISTFDFFSISLSLLT